MCCENVENYRWRQTLRNDRHIFKFKTDCRNICEIPKKLMYLVKTKATNFAQRNIIRTTWGSEVEFFDIRTVFLLGELTEEESDFSYRLNAEAENFQDLIQGNFIDTYYNLTRKTMMGLKWSHEFCFENTEFFMFVDDDYYVSTRNVLLFLKNPMNYPGTEQYWKNTTNFHTDHFPLYAGYIHKKASPIRNYFSKWYVSLSEYPYDRYPPYSAGGAYILSRRSLEKFSMASYFTEIIHLEDLFIGFLAYEVGVRPVVNNDHFRIEGEYVFREYRKVLAAHGHDDPEKLWDIWNEQMVADRLELEPNVENNSYSLA